MKKRINHFFILQRLGSNIVLFAIDISVIVLFIVYDVYQLNTYTGLTIFQENSIRNLFENINYTGVAISFGFLTTIPLLVAILGFIFPKMHSHKNTSYTFRNLFYLIHVVIAVLLCIMVSNIENFQRIAGYSLQVNRQGESVLKDNYNSWLIYFMVGSSFAFTLIFYIVKLLLFKRINVDEKWDRFIELADITAEYMPNQDTRKWIVYFNNASMSPDIKWIVNKSKDYRYEYQKKIPTSEEAKDYLKEIANTCRETLIEYLVNSGVKYSNRYNVEFYSGTSRALEVILSRLKNIMNIIISPFEHHSQVDVVKWYQKNNRGISVFNMPFDKLYLDNTTNRKEYDEANLIDALYEKINEIKSAEETIAILISEVHYLTGYKIDLVSVISKLRESYPNLIFIIDGSQAVGNIEKPYITFENLLGKTDFYYFSAHKWLLSPNTCGVAISKKYYEDEDRSYDVFDKIDLPTSTIEPNTIFGLRASLDFIFLEMTFEKIKNKSLILRQYFEKKLPSSFEFIGNIKRTESSFITIKPKDNYKWIADDSEKIMSHFKSKSVDATIFETKKEANAEHNDFWVRLSFPFFIEIFQIDKLVRILSKCVSIRE